MPRKSGPLNFPFLRCRGFTLVEVVVSASLLAIGMLGLAALQGKGMRFAMNAYYSGQAAILATDIVDRIRANKVGLGAYTTNAGGTINGTDNQCMSDENAGAAKNCTPAQLAANDIFHWKQYVARGLPNGSGQVTYVTATPAGTTFNTQVTYVSVAAGGNLTTNVTCPALPNQPTTFYLITIAWNAQNFNTAQDIANANNPDQTYTLCLTNP